MDGGVERIGLEAFMGTDAFQKGMSAYMKMMDEMEKGTISSATQINQAMAKVQQAMGVGLKDASASGASGLTTMGAAGSVLSKGSAILAGAIGGVVAMVGTALVGAVGKAVSAYWSLVQEGFALAARVEQMDFMLQALGARYGYTTQQVRDQTQAIVDYGIRTDVAQDTVAQFIRYELDMAKASDLARAAQDAATLSNTDSSTELQRLLYGIQTQQTEVLRTAGIQINMNEAMKKYAEANNLSVESMTAAQRANAVLNAVLEEGARNAGLYEASMESVGKQIGSLKGREFPEFTRALSQAFLPAMLTVVKTVRELLKAWTEALNPGGRLFKLMTEIGAVASFLADGLSVAAKAISNWILGITGTFDVSFVGLIDSMFTWGIDTAESFAEGLIEGASNAIVGAINYISSMFSNWFAPGSPPRVAPLIDKWGMATIAEWLHGFTQGDFSVLKTIQQPLKSALDTLAGIGQISKGGSQAIFADISKMLINAMSGEGLPTEAEFQALADATGMFGNEIADLARKQVQLALAENQVQKAAEAVIAARKAELVANLKVDKGIREYNDMLRRGAGKDALAAKLAQINADKKLAGEATDQRVEAENALSVQEQQLQGLREAVDLQKQLVDQMIELAKANADATETQPTGGGGGGATQPTKPTGGGGTLPEGFEVDTGPITKAIDQMKADIAWKIQMLVLRVKLAWIHIKQDAMEKWKEIEGAVGDFIARIILGWIQKFDQVKTSIRDALVALLSGIAVGAIEQWDAFKKGWDEFWIKVRDGLVEALSGIAVWAIEKWTEFKDNAIEKWNEMEAGLAEIMSKIALGWLQKLTDIKRNAIEKWNEIKTNVTSKVEEVRSNILSKFDEVKQGIKDRVDGIGETIVTALQGIPERFEELKEGLKEMGKNIIQSIIDGFAEIDLVQKLIELAKEAIRAALETFDMGSPSKIFTWMGRNIAKSLGSGIAEETKVPVKMSREMAVSVTKSSLDALRQAQQIARMATVPVAAAPSISRVVNNNLNLNYGGVNVSGGMGWEQMKSGLRQIIREEFGR